MEARRNPPTTQTVFRVVLRRERVNERKIRNRTCAALVRQRVGVDDFNHRANNRAGAGVSVLEQVQHQIHIQFRASGFMRLVWVHEKRNGIKTMLHDAERHRSHAAIFAGFDAGLAGPSREFDVNRSDGNTNAEMGDPSANRVRAAFLKESVAEKPSVPVSVNESLADLSVLRLHLLFDFIAVASPTLQDLETVVSQIERRLDFLQTTPSFSRTRSRSLRFTETGEISPLPSGRWRGELSRSGSPFGLDLRTSKIKSPVMRGTRLLSLFVLIN